MKTRHAVLTLLALSVIGVGALSFLGARGKLPPALASAYTTVEALASSATTSFSAQRAVTDRPDAGDTGDAGLPTARRTPQAAPLSSAQLGAPLVHGKFVSECGAPDDMKVVVKVTVKMGRAVAVSATTLPVNAAVAACVEKATREMQWDVNPKAQRLTVTY